MGMALRLGRLLIDHARAAFALLGTDAADTDAVALVRWIKAEGREQFTRREAQKGQEGRFRSGERLDKALDRLVDGESLREFKLVRPGMRPSKAYRVNPRLLSS